MNKTFAGASGLCRTHWKHSRKVYPSSFILHPSSFILSTHSVISSVCGLRRICRRAMTRLIAWRKARALASITSVLTARPWITFPSCSTSTSASP